MRITSVEVLIEQLDRYVKAIAYRKARDNVLSVMLDADDIVNELQIELVICWDYYSGSVTDDELLKLARTMIGNRLSELIHRYHGTHRQTENYNASLSDLVVDVEDGCVGPSIIVETQERIQTFYDSLSEEEAAIVAAVVDSDHKAMTLWFQVYRMRKTAAYTKPTVRITPDLVADALHMSRADARLIFKSIQRKWRNAYDE